MSERGVVNILDSKDVSAGTGFFVSEDGFILTCYHVVEKASLNTSDFLSRVKIRMDETTHFVIVKCYCKESDVAILKSDIPTDTFFELKTDFLRELYQLLELSLDTSDYVSPKMASKIEKKIVKGAFKTWSKVYRKHRWKKHFYSLRSLMPKEDVPVEKPVEKSTELSTALVVKSN